MIQVDLIRIIHPEMDDLFLRIPNRVKNYPQIVIIFIPKYQRHQDILVLHHTLQMKRVLMYNHIVSKH